MQIDILGTKSGLSFSGSEVTSAHFGGNFLFDRDRVGDVNSGFGPSQTFDDASRALGLTGIRYPGGSLTERCFDLNNPNSALQNFSQTSQFDPDRNGPQLPSTLGLDAALDFAAADGLSFTLVLPTFRYLGVQADSNGNRFEAVDTAAVAEFIISFLTEAAAKGVEIAAIELGNEWWIPIDDSFGGAMSATEYGRIASRLASTVQQAFDQFSASQGPNTWHEPEIVVQVGRGGALEWVTPGGNRPPADYGGTLVKATTLIFNEFNNDAELQAVDGLVTHRYLNGSIENVNGWAYKPFDTWSSLAKEKSDYRELTRYVTEWNVSASNQSFTGINQPRALVGLFQEMVEAGVDSASIWGIQQNNSARFTLNVGWSGESFRGLTAAGQTFQLMADSLVGLKSIDLKLAQPELDVAGFGSQERAVLFISNTALTTGSYSFDANDLTDNFTHIWARKVNMSSSGAAGGSSAAWIEVLSTQDHDGTLFFNLDPNELIAIEVTFGEVGVSMTGGERDDRMSGSSLNDAIFGGAGADQILGGDGNDMISGGNGADTLAGGRGSDSLDGGDGFDFVDYSGSTCAVRVDLQFSLVNSFDAAGDTFEFIEGILGSSFDDDLRGDAAANSIIGGDGKDFLRGRGGDDSLFGGEGNDVIWGGAGVDRINGAGGRDRAQYSEATSGVLVDLAFSILNTGEASGDTYKSVEDIFGSSFNDRLRGDANNNMIWGGAGRDFLQGRAGNDVLYGGIGADTFFFAKNWGSDKVMDFEGGVDTINLVGFGITSDSAESYFGQVGPDLVFEFGMSRLFIYNANFEDICSDLNFI